jgi:dipeptidyl aminopeptidase/acylaminoacyl peptidase
MPLWGLKRIVLMISLVVAAKPVLPAPTQADDGKLLQTLTYSFPDYDKVEGIEFHTNKTEYIAAVSDKNYEFKKLQYLSDGLRVVAYLYKPVVTGESTIRKLPLIVFNRGSGPAGDYAPLLISLFHRLASRGYVILAPQYRQSDGGEGHDEIGGADLDDVKNMIPLARSLGFVDMDNVFLYGESRGGMMTYQAVRDGMPVNAAAVSGAFTDLEIMNQSPYVQKLIHQTWPDYDHNKEAIIRRRSAKYWPEKFSVPVLIINGGADQQVNPSQPLQLALQLQSLGKTYGLIIYAGDNHFVQANRLDRDNRALAWFEVNMK